MQTYLLFPSTYHHLALDPHFELEANAWTTVGGTSYVFDHDAWVQDQKFFTNLPHTVDQTSLILRGWMLTPAQYTNLYQKLVQRNYWLINTPEQYRHCHHFPYVYEDIKEFTPAIDHFKWVDYSRPQLQTILDRTSYDFLLKDYVKSEKGTDLFHIERPITAEALEAKLHAFVALRDPLFNEGIVLKQWEPLKQTSKTTNEWRAFFYRGILLSLAPNSNQLTVREPNPLDITKVAARITNHPEPHSLFFTLDLAETEDGAWTVLEAGDGQVSGLAAGAHEIKFYEVLFNLIKP